MVDDRPVVRADVARMVARFVRLRSDGALRSAAGGLAIDDSRDVRRHPGVVELDGLTVEETLTLIYIAHIRRAVYATPQPRADVIGSDGLPMRAVAPQRDLVHVVRVRPRRSVYSGESAALMWFISVDALFERIPSEARAAILEAEADRQELVVLRHRLQAARTVAQRLRGGGKNAQNLRRRAEEEVAELHSSERAVADRLTRQVHTSVYRNGLDMLLNVCTATPAIEDLCFGRRR